MKQIFLTIIILFSFVTFAQNKGLIISEIFTNPTGNDSPFEYIECVATTNIDFSVTPYAIVFTDNGAATNNGWSEGGAISYAFTIDSGSATKGQVVYVGGSSMLPLSNSCISLKSKNTATSSGDSFGSANLSGVLGQGGSNADGVAIFNTAASNITSTTIPIDAIFFGSTIGNAFKSISSGYQLPINDTYTGGKLQNNSFIALDPASNEILKASGLYDAENNIFTTTRTWSITTVATFNSSSVILSTTSNPTISLAITSPIEGTIFAAPADVLITASASSSDGNITKVEFYNGTSFLGSDNDSPYTFLWSGVVKGSYVLLAKAFNDKNVEVTSSNINITVADNNTAPTLSFNNTASKYVNLSSGKISCVMDNDTDPFVISGLDINVNDENLNTVTFSINSSNTSVLPNTNFTIIGTSTSRKFKINPIGVGYTTLSLTVTDDQGLKKSISLSLAVSASLLTKYSKDIYHTGVADGSTAIPVDDNYMFVADDETNVIKLYDRNHSGLSLYQFDVNPYLNLSGTEVDIEASFRSPTKANRIYWMGSLSNSKSGQLRPDRNRIFATDIVGTGADAQLVFVGYYDGLRNNLISWGNSNGYDFTSKTAVGIEPKRIDGFNIEGLEIGPDASTLYIAFRAPYVGQGNNKALICPLLNFEIWFGSGSPKTNPQFGSAIELDLDNHGIRSLAKNNLNKYIIVAGSYASSGSFELYSWDGLSTAKPNLLTVDLDNLNPEGIVEVPDDISNDFSIDIISDLGANVLYNDGIENKAVAESNHRKFLTSTLQVNPGSLAIDSDGNDCKKNEIYLFPNPVQTHLNIVFNNDTYKDLFCHVYNSTGILIKTTVLNSNENITTIDFSDFHSGLYFVTIPKINKVFPIVK